MRSIGSLWTVPLLLLVGCGGGDIYDTWLAGDVRIEPVNLPEGLDHENESFDIAFDLGTLGIRPVVIDGTSEWYGYKRGEASKPPPELPGKADEDWFKFTLAAATTVEFHVVYPETPRGLWIRFGVYEIGEESATELYSEDVLAGEGDVEIRWMHSAELAADKTYALRIGGIAGDKLQNWTTAITGAAPQTMKVGAYSGVDGELDSVARRGSYLGGAEVNDFALTEDWAWRGRYELILGQDAGPTDKPKKADLLDIDPDITELWVMGLSSDDLASPVIGGTMYGSTPVYVDLEEADREKGEHDKGHWAKKFSYVPVNDVLVDSEVPETIGWWTFESEPNDADLVELEEGGIVVVGSSLPKCSDVGAMTGAGRTDRLEGDLELGRGEGPLVHGNDCFAFTVPASGQVSMSLAFDGTVASNLDAVIWNGAGEVVAVAQGGPGANPDVSTAVVLEPSTPYYAMVVGQLGDIDGKSRYTLDLVAAPEAE